VAVDDLGMAGLPVASVVRTAKIATIQSRDAHRLGCISAGQLGPVRQLLTSTLGL
jgi:mRNA interferase MazF